MGSTVTHKARKATFNTKVDSNKVRHFTPVNRHAKTFATVLGLSELEVKDLKAIKKAGFRPYHYTDGKLRAITL